MNNKNDAYFVESYSLWHAKLGHVNYDNLRSIINTEHIPNNFKLIVNTSAKLVARPSYTVMFVILNLCKQEK